LDKFFKTFFSNFVIWQLKNGTIIVNSKLLEKINLLKDKHMKKLLLAGIIALSLTSCNELLKWPARWERALCLFLKLKIQPV
jgi:hypothetical protein